MIQQGGTGEAAVVQFLEKLERLGQDRSQLEDALTRFGTDQWDWFMPDSTVGAVLNSATGETQTQVLLQPQSPLTNPGRINKKHKGEEEEVHSDSESDDDRTIGRISTNVFCKNVQKEFRQIMYIQ